MYTQCIYNVYIHCIFNKVKHIIAVLLTGVDIRGYTLYIMYIHC